MTQSDVQNVLSVMCAPALVCSDAGTVIAANKSADDWLGISRSDSIGQALGTIIETSGETLDEFLQRSQFLGHANCKVVVRHNANTAQNAPMSCHGQRLLGLVPAENLLLVFTNNEMNAVHGRRVLDENTGTEPYTHSHNGTAAAISPPSLTQRSDMNTLNEVAIGLIHEVNQPLAAISTYAYSCQRWLGTGVHHHPKLLPTVEKIIQQVQLTGQMINGLKGLVRGHAENREICDLKQLMRESLAALALDPRIEHCILKSQLDEAPCPVMVRPVQIKIVLLNLLRNALDASLICGPDDASMCVTVKPYEGGWAIATISDSGAGINAQTSEQLFQPFMTTKSEGLGLGLVISRCLATAHAGCIEFHPGLPSGTSFQLRLPLAR